MDQVKFMEDSLWKILLGPFLDTLSQMSGRVQNTILSTSFMRRNCQVVHVTRNFSQDSNDKCGDDFLG